MKKLNLSGLLGQILLTFGAAFSAVGCLSTAFSLPISAGPLLLACGCFSVLTALAPRLRRGWLVLLIAMALAALFFWRRDAHQSLLTLVELLLQTYRLAYGWVVPSWIAAGAGADMTLGVALIATVSTLLVGMGLAGGMGLAAVLGVLLPVVPCFVVTDTQPSTLWLLVMMLCLVLILLSQTVRKLDPARAGRVVAYALLPAALCLCLLLGLYPKDQYQKPDPEQDFADRMLEFVDSLPYLKVEDGQVVLDFEEVPYFTFPPQTLPFGSGDFTIPPITIDPGIVDIFKDVVSLDKAGPRDPGDTVIMELATNYHGDIYLRERGYDVYTGLSWASSGAEQSIFIDEQYLDRLAREVNITTLWSHSNYFLPYYRANEDVFLPDGKMANPEGKRQYSFRMHMLSGGWKGLWMTYRDIPLSDLQAQVTYDLPETTLEEAKEILNAIGIHENMSALEAVLRIQDYVKSSATYDMNTQAMPQEYGDFAIWFLRESDTGYCVHFASAATVLLRAAGIQARYVEGYMTKVNAKNTQVLASDAHAWVEYYLPGAGWLVLEATPGEGYVPVYRPDTTPTEPTTVPTTPPTTLPTLPTVPTEPTTLPPTTVPVTTRPVTQPTTTAPPTVPPTTAPQTPPEPGKDYTKLFKTLEVLLWLLVSAGALYGQLRLRLWLCRRWLRRGEPNQRAIKLWKRSRMYAVLRRQQVPRALRELAWKAKFSQHTLTDAELAAFEAYHGRSVAHLRTRPWYLQLVYRLVFAAY